MEKKKVKFSQMSSLNEMELTMNNLELLNDINGIVEGGNDGVLNMPSIDENMLHPFVNNLSYDVNDNLKTNMGLIVNSNIRDYSNTSSTSTTYSNNCSMSDLKYFDSFGEHMNSCGNIGIGNNNNYGDFSIFQNDLLDSQHCVNHCSKSKVNQNYSYKCTNINGNEGIKDINNNMSFDDTESQYGLYDVLNMNHLNAGIQGNAKSISSNKDLTKTNKQCGNSFLNMNFSNNYSNFRRKGRRRKPEEIESWTTIIPYATIEEAECFVQTSEFRMRHVYRDPRAISFVYRCVQHVNCQFEMRIYMSSAISCYVQQRGQHSLALQEFKRPGLPQHTIPFIDTLLRSRVPPKMVISKLMEKYPEIIGDADYSVLYRQITNRQQYIRKKERFCFVSNGEMG